VVLVPFYELRQSLAIKRWRVNRFLYAKSRVAHPLTINPLAPARLSQVGRESTMEMALGSANVASPIVQWLL
jgi:hypothetical protein